MSWPEAFVGAAEYLSGAVAIVGLCWMMRGLYGD